MSNTQKLLLMLSFIIYFSNTTFGQHANRNVGISIGMQDLHLDFNIPVHIANNIVLAPSFGIISTSKNASDISYGSSLKLYIKDNKLSPFLGGRIGAITLLPEEGDNLTDYLFGVFFGTEYNIDKNLSISGELQMNITSSDESSNRFGNPGGTNINTGTFLYITFYFD